MQLSGDRDSCPTAPTATALPLPPNSNAGRFVPFVQLDAGEGDLRENGADGSRTRVRFSY